MNKGGERMKIPVPGIGPLAMTDPSPTPLPSPGDSTQSDGQRRYQHLQDLYVSVTTAVDHAVRWLVTAGTVLVKVLVVLAAVAVVFSIVVRLGRLFAPASRSGTDRQKRGCFRLVPPGQTEYDPESWVAFFQGL